MRTASSDTPPVASCFGRCHRFDDSARRQDHRSKRMELVADRHRDSPGPLLLVGDPERLRITLRGGTPLPLRRDGRGTAVLTAPGRPGRWLPAGRRRRCSPRGRRAPQGRDMWMSTPRRSASRCGDGGGHGARRGPPAPSAGGRSPPVARRLLGHGSLARPPRVRAAMASGNGGIGVACDRRSGGLRGAHAGGSPSRREPVGIGTCLEARSGCASVVRRRMLYR